MTTMPASSISFKADSSDGPEDEEKSSDPLSLDVAGGNGGAATVWLAVSLDGVVETAGAVRCDQKKNPMVAAIPEMTPRV
jgi:hypothetical protein